MNQNTKIPNRAMAILPLRGLNIFPGMLLSFDVERPISLAALNCAQNNDQEIFLVTQKDISNDMPQLSDLYEYGVVCRIRQFVQSNGRGTLQRKSYVSCFGSAVLFRRDRKRA